MPARKERSQILTFSLLSLLLIIPILLPLRYDFSVLSITYHREKLVTCYYISEDMDGEVLFSKLNQYINQTNETKTSILDTLYLTLSNYAKNQSRIGTTRCTKVYAPLFKTIRFRIKNIDLDKNALYVYLVDENNHTDYLVITSSSNDFAIYLVAMSTLTLYILYQLFSAVFRDNEKVRLLHYLLVLVIAYFAITMLIQFITWATSGYAPSPANIIASTMLLALLMPIVFIALLAYLVCDTKRNEETCLVKTYRNLGPNKYSIALIVLVTIATVLVSGEYVYATTRPLSIVSSITPLTYLIPLALLAINNPEALKTAGLVAIVIILVTLVLEALIVIILYSKLVTTMLEFSLIPSFITIIIQLSKLIRRQNSNN